MTSRCCRLRTFLIIFQIVLGLAITGLCVYLHLYMPVFSLRDKPFWAGIPLLVAGLLATSFFSRNKNDEGCTSSCVFIFKILSVILTIISIFTCVTSTVFSSLHVYKLFSFSHCRHLDNGCLCFYDENQSPDDTDGGRLYTPVQDCYEVFCLIKIFLCSSGGLCFLGTVCASSFTLAVWNSAYGSTSH